MDSKNIANAAIMVAMAVIIVLVGAYVPPLFFILFFCASAYKHCIY